MKNLLRYLMGGIMLLFIPLTANPKIELPIYTHHINSILITRATVYQAVPSQTNDDNLITASGFKLDSLYEHSKHRIIAISRDLKEYLPFGSAVLIEGTDKYDGVWYVHDVMNKRYEKSIDFLTDIGTPNVLYSDVILTPIVVSFKKSDS
jgi:3D (Asp-Asp-Asp) domain-containing protein